MPVPTSEKAITPRRRGRPPSADRPDGADEQRFEAVERALSALDAFGDGTPRLSLAEIAERTGLYPSTILRLAASLDRFGYLHRGADGLFRLGPTPLRPGLLYRDAFDPADHVRPALARLVERTGETAAFYVRDGERRVCLYPGEHQPTAPRALWDRVHAGLQESQRVRTNQNRRQTPALLRGLIFGPDGRAMSSTHTRRRGRLYRYYVSQAVLKGESSDCPVRRLSAAEIEAAVVDQVRALLRQPEVVVGTRRAARAEAPDLTEAETLAVLERLDPLWDELFPAEQARIVRLLVERVEITPTGADIRLRLEGLASLVRDLGGIGAESRRAA